MATGFWVCPMTYSRNEIGSLFRKAGIGAGLSSGVAEDISRAGLWLLVRDMAGDGAVLQGISRFEPHKSINRGESQNIVIERFCSVLDGPSIFDLAAASVDNFQARLLQIDNPMLLLGIAGVAASDYNLKIAIEFSETPPFVLDSDGPTANNIAVPDQGADAVLTCQKGAPDRKKPPEIGSTVGIDGETYKELLRHAAKTYVPATAASREKGAGAGLTDND